MSALRPAVFLDRDGTVNVDTEFVGTPEGVVRLKEEFPGISRMQTGDLLLDPGENLTRAEAKHEGSPVLIAQDSRS